MDPQYAEMLREEVETIVKEHGWTKEALTHMRKIDSFLKEVQRFEGPAVRECIFLFYSSCISYLYSTSRFVHRRRRNVWGLIGGVVGVPRKVLQDAKLSDGTVIPKGTFVSLPTYAIHHDHDIYEHPDVFDPLRFVRLEDTKQGPEAKFQLVAVSRDSLTFGFGKSAWYVCDLGLSSLSKTIPLTRLMLALRVMIVPAGSSQVWL